MRKALPQMLELSRVLMAHEARTRKVAAAITAADVCEKLRPKLSILMGATGFRTLLARALALASREAPLLRELKVDKAGALVPLETAIVSGDTPNDIASGALLIAQLLSVLAALIGESLTTQILVEIWPHLLADLANSKTGERE